MKRISMLMAEAGVDVLIAATPVDIFYLTGRVLNGYVVLVAGDPEPWLFVRRPVGLEGERVRYVRKPEQLPELLAAEAGLAPSSVRRLAVELDSLSYTDCRRLAALWPEAGLTNADALLRRSRAVKTEAEQELMRRCGRVHAQCYAAVPEIYRPGMTDHEFALRFELLQRRMGHIGLFRTFGPQMEAFMGSSYLIGDNADAPSPYDFALGGAGMSEALPMGGNGSVLQPGQTLMVDGGGCFGPYMTDMTRVYTLGDPARLAPLALRAHACSIAVHDLFRREARPGVPCADLYGRALALVEAEGLRPYFMGHRQQAAFVGHGVGLQINELPVLHAKSRDVLEAGHAVALEPKFVIPGVGAVGIENTYLIHEDRAECLTELDEEIRGIE